MQAKRPRSYQLRALDAVEDAFTRGIKRPVIAQATGLGKTFLAANLIKRRAHLGRALFLAPIDEVVFQNAKAVQAENPGLRVGIVKAALNQKHAPVVIASLHTIRKKARLAMFLRHCFQTIIVDECHLNLTAYAEVIDHVAAPDALVCGLSATPFRLDGRGLDEVFDELLPDAEMSLIDGIREGWLCEPISLQFSLKGADFSNIHSRKGDLDQNEVAEFIRRADNWKEKIVDEWRQHAGHLKTAMFVARVEMAKELADYMRSIGIRAVAIDGAMDKAVRRNILAQYEAGQIQVVINVACLNTGWDSPSTECLLIATLTASKSRYIQTLGRGTRLLPGTIDGLDTAAERLAAIAASHKPNFLVMDLVGVTRRHKLVNLATLAGKDKPSRNGEGFVELAADGEREKAALLAEQEERERIEGELEARRVKLVDLGQGHSNTLKWEPLEAAPGWYVATALGHTFRIMPHYKGDHSKFRADFFNDENGEFVAVSGKMSTIDSAKAFCQLQANSLFAKSEKAKKPAPFTFSWHHGLNYTQSLTIKNKIITVRPMADDSWLATDKAGFMAICGTSEEAVKRAEEFARTLLFAGRPASEKQLALLAKFRIPVKEGIGMDEASRLIDARFKRVKQQQGKGRVAA